MKGWKGLKGRGRLKAKGEVMGGGWLKGRLKGLKGRGWLKGLKGMKRVKGRGRWIEVRERGRGEVRGS